MIEEYLAASEVAIRQLDAGAIETAAHLVSSALFKGNQLFLCGNGGSAADASHLAGEFVGRFATEREPWPAMALADHTATMTAIANDYGYEEVFARQLRGFGRSGDVLCCFSTSGLSRNIRRAAETGRQMGMTVIAFIGQNAPAMDEAVVTIRAGNATPLAQQAHMVAGHLICALVEAKLHG